MKAAENNAGFLCIPEQEREAIAKYSKSWRPRLDLADSPYLFLDINGATISSNAVARYANDSWNEYRKRNDLPEKKLVFNHIRKMAQKMFTSVQLRANIELFNKGSGHWYTINLSYIYNNKLVFFSERIGQSTYNLAAVDEAIHFTEQLMKLSEEKN